MTTSSKPEQTGNLLLSCYQQWFTLTEAEGEAIRSGHWSEVGRLQAGKRQLRESIVAATEALRAEARSSGADLSAIENKFRSLIGHLIERVSSNREAISQRQQRMKADLAKLEAIHLILRQVQGAYAPVRAAVWQAYS